MDLDALQQQRFIKLRQLKQEIDVATKGLEQFNVSKEKIGEELKELGAYKEKQKQQYGRELIIKQGLEKDTETTRTNLSKLKTQSKDIIKRLDDEILAKTATLNSFKDSKKHFVKSLEVRETNLQQDGEALKQQSVELSNADAVLKEKEKLAENGLVSAQKREEVAKDLQDHLSRTQGHTERQNVAVKTKLSNIERIEQEKEQELEKQQKITEESEDQNKILKLKTEAQDRREAPLRRFEKELKIREAKLLDDRNALNRAIAEKLR